MKSTSRKFHHLARTHSNRRPRYFKVFRKAKIRRIPDLEPLNIGDIPAPDELFKASIIQPVEMLEPLNFIKEEFLAAIKLNPEPLRHFTIIKHDTGAYVVMFDNLDWHFQFDEALELWRTYLSKDELQKFAPDLKDLPEGKWNLNYNIYDIPRQGTPSYPISSTSFRIHGENAWRVHQEFIYRRNQTPPSCNM